MQLIHRIGVADGLVILTKAIGCVLGGGESSWHLKVLLVWLQ